MNLYTLLIKTKYFPTNIKSDSHLLINYVIDYSYNTCLLLEQINAYRYSRFHSYYLGNINPEKIKEFVSGYDPTKFFYCNKRCSTLTNDELKEILFMPENYAVVLFNYYI